MPEKLTAASEEELQIPERNSSGSKKNLKAIKHAMSSDKGARLLEIAREHVKLLREITIYFDHPHHRTSIVNDSSADIYHARIEQLMRERDEIIKRFKEEGEDDPEIPFID